MRIGHRSPPSRPGARSRSAYGQIMGQHSGDFDVGACQCCFADIFAHWSVPCIRSGHDRDGMSKGICSRAGSPFSHDAFVAADCHALARVIDMLACIRHFKPLLQTMIQLVAQSTASSARHGRLLRHSMRAITHARTCIRVEIVEHKGESRCRIAIVAVVISLSRRIFSILISV